MVETSVQIQAQIQSHLESLSQKNLQAALDFVLELADREREAASTKSLSPVPGCSDSEDSTITLGYPPVDQDLLSKIVSRICRVGSPLKVILFGSWARGDARDSSDIDLLIVEESDRPRHERARPYYVALKDVLPPQDIVVWTPEEIEEWKSVPAAFVTTALREGIALYQTA